MPLVPGATTVWGVILSNWLALAHALNATMGGGPQGVRWATPRRLRIGRRLFETKGWQFEEQEKLRQLLAIIGQQAPRY